MNHKVALTTIDAFITRIWVFDLSEKFSSRQQQWLDSISEMRANQPVSVERSNRSGWNSEKILFSNPVFEPLKEVANVCFKHALKELEIQDYETIEYWIEAWANCHEPGGYNLKHLHAHVVLSGCFYLDVPEGSGDIVFSDPRPGSVHAPIYGDNKFMASSVVYTPKRGRLVIFPNYLEHHVEQNNSHSQRISIAMNAIRGAELK